MYGDEIKWMQTRQNEQWKDGRERVGLRREEERRKKTIT